MLFPIHSGEGIRKLLLPWKPSLPTEIQLNQNKRRGNSENLDLLDIAFKLADCTREHSIDESNNRFIQFARVYGPLGIQLAIKPHGKFPTELAEDILEWHTASIEIRNFFEAWLKHTNGWPDKETERSIQLIAARHLTSVALVPVKPARKNQATWVPIAKTLLTALWLKIWAEYSQGTDIGRCHVCNEWFFAKGHQKSGVLPKKSCGNACNQKSRYWKKRTGTS